MKIVVTGVAGAIGSHLAERLLDLGHDVVGIDAITPYYSPEIKKINIKDVEEKGGIVHILDLSKNEIRHLFNDVDIVFHFAAQPGISSHVGFEEYLENNIISTHKVLEVLKEIPTLKLLVYASTSSVYGSFANGNESSEPKPTSNYGVTKLAGEQLALSYHREKDLPVTVLRFFSVYGERERPEKLYHKLIKAMSEDREFFLFDGAREHIRSYTYISDIIDGCVLVMENREKAIGNIYNLGNDKTMTTGEGIEIIENIFNKPAKIIILPKRAGDQKETSANIEKINNTFGYEPKVSLVEGLKNQVKWYREKIHNLFI